MNPGHRVRVSASAIVAEAIPQTTPLATGGPRWPATQAWLAVHRWALSTVLILVLPAFVYREAVTGTRTFVFSDNADYFLPTFHFVWRSWRAASAPWWNPYAFGGYSMLGTGQGAVFYPGNAMYAFAPPVVAATATTLAHLAFGGLGMQRWARRLTNDVVASTVAGVGFMLCGFLAWRSMHPSLLNAAAWTPWVVLAWDRAVERLTPGRVAVVSAGLAMIALQGHPQMLWVVLVMLSGMALGRIVTGTRWRRVLGATIAAAVGCGGLAAVQLLPQLQWSTLSVREGRGFLFSMKHHLPLSHLVIGVWPFSLGGFASGGRAWIGESFAHELAFYPGMIAIVVAAVGLGRWSALPVAARALVVPLGVSLLLMLGDETPFGPIAYLTVPLAKSFRAWGRNALAFDVLFISFGAIALATIRRTPNAFSRSIWRSGVGFVFLTAVVAWRAEIHGVRSSGADRFVVPVVLFLLTASVLWALRTRPNLGGLLIVLALVDGVGFARATDWGRLGPSTVEADRLLAAGPEHLTHDSTGGIDRIASTGDLLRMRPTLWRRFGVGGYDPLAPARYASLTGIDDLGRSGPRMYQRGSWVPDVLRVTTVLVSGRPPVPLDPRWGLVGGSAGVARFVTTPRLADAYLVSQTAVVSDAELTAALAGTGGPDLRRTALLDSPCAECPTARASAGAMRSAGVVGSAVFGTGAVDVELDARGPSVLVVAQAWAPGWQAFADGRSARVVRVDGLVTGVVLPNGARHVSLRYRPPGLVAGALISGSTVAGFVVLCIWWPRRRSGASAGRPHLMGVT